MLLGYAAESRAADWPWKKKPDVVTASCSLDRDEVEQGSTAVLRAKVQASDSRGHALSYVWSANGGKVAGVGPEIQVETAGLNPGVYSVLARVQDAYQQSASCTLNYHVVPPPDNVTMTSCTVAPETVEQGKEATLRAQASDALGHPLRYRWHTNGGTLSGDGPQVTLQTTDLRPGVYTVTGRAEDAWGRASDCAAIVKVALPPPPPVPLQPAKFGEIVFLRNKEKFQGNGEALLQKLVARLNSEHAGRISIEAYAGPDEANANQLAAERAETVKRFLVQNGVSESRLQITVGLGGMRGGLRNRTLDIIWLPDGLEY